LARIDTHLNATRYYSGLEYRDLMMLLELTNSISAVRNPMKILQMIVARMSLVIEVARCSIVGMDSNGELVVKASTDLGNDSEIRLEMSRYPEIRAALETRQAIALNDFQNDPLMAPVRQYVSGLSFQSIIVVPIIKKATAIGTLFLRTASSHKGGITDRVYNLCHLVANISANALENASLFESMKTAQEYLEEMAIRDGLTRLFTHQNFYERLDEEFSRALRHQQPLSLIFFDIDNFKRVNDTYGHTRGDEVLRKIGRVVREVIRESDIPARYGGEEFAVLLPNTPAEGAMEMTSRMCAIIRELRFDFMNDQHVTISAGVSTFSPNELQSFDQLVRLADRAMYQAKTEGKDRVVAATDPSLLDQPSWKSTPNP
jgi:two-component system cell cycle response regulator